MPELSKWRACIHQSFLWSLYINLDAVIDPDAQKLGYVGEDGIKMPDHKMS
jgi:hypothetical protein